MSGVYALTAVDYHDKGYGPLPIPTGAKHPPPPGWTGRGAPMPSRADVEAWIEERPDHNVALRLPPGVLGVDVDAHSGKPGADTLARWQDEAGVDLPASAPWSSSRDCSVSGIRLVQVPHVLELRSPGPGIDLITNGHRYMVAPGSVVDGRQYRWLTDLAPAAALPWLPAPMLALIKAPEPAGDLVVAGGDLTAGDPGLAATYVTRYGRDVALGKSRHDSMQAALCWAHRESAAGLVPWAAAVDALGRAWQDTAVGPARTTDLDEFMSMVRWAEDHALERPLSAQGAAMVMAPTTTTQKAPAPVSVASGAVLEPFSGIGMSQPEWLWPERVPRGAITVLGGPEGSGKTNLAVWLAARVSRGDVPGAGRVPGNVLIVSTEDDASATLKPRLVAAGAQLDRVFRVRLETDGERRDFMVTLPGSIDTIRALVIDHDIDLLVLDPLLGMVADGVDTHKDAEFRRALEPLSELGRDTGVTIVGLTHFNKSGSATALNRIMAGKALTAVARSVLAVVRDGDEGDGRLLLHLKSNLGPLQPTRQFSVIGTRVQEGILDVPASTVEMGADVEMDADDAIERSEERAEDREPRQECQDEIRHLLATGPRPADEVRQALKAKGHAQTTITRALAGTTRTYRVGSTRFRALLAP